MIRLSLILLLLAGCSSADDYGKLGLTITMPQMVTVEDFRKLERRATVLECNAGDTEACTALSEY